MLSMYSVEIGEGVLDKPRIAASARMKWASETSISDYELTIRKQCMMCHSATRKVVNLLNGVVESVKVVPQIL